MLETIISEKRIALPPPPPQQQQQVPAVQPAPQPAGRFKGMLARAGTLNGRKASTPIPAPQPIPVPNIEKALPQPFGASPSPGFSPSPEPQSLGGTPLVDPMGDGAPVAPITAHAGRDTRSEGAICVRCGARTVVSRRCTRCGSRGGD